MEVYSLKLKTGVDLIGECVFVDETMIILKNPIELNINPEYGIFVKQWNNFIENVCIPFLRSDSYFVFKANNRATDYYNTFLQSQAELEAATILRSKELELKPTLH